MQDIGHQGLEAHVLDTSDHLGGLEVLVRAVSATLPEVVDEVSGIDNQDAAPQTVQYVRLLGDFSKSTTFFPEVDDQADATSLGAPNGLFDSEDEVRLARADVGTEDIRAVAWSIELDLELLL